MKFIVKFTLFVCTAIFVSTNAHADSKIVVIPLGGDPVRLGEPVSYTCSLFMADTEGFDSCQFSEVPEGKVFVIEFVNGAISLENGQTPQARMGESTTNSFTSTDYLHFEYDGPFTSTKSQYIISQPVKIYIDEKTTPSIRASRFVKNGTASGRFYLRGYLVDIK